MPGGWGSQRGGCGAAAAAVGGEGMAPDRQTAPVTQEAAGDASVPSLLLFPAMSSQVCATRLPITRAARAPFSTPHRPPVCRRTVCVNVCVCVWPRVSSHWPPSRIRYARCLRGRPCEAEEHTALGVAVCRLGVADHATRLHTHTDALGMECVAVRGEVVAVMLARGAVVCGKGGERGGGLVVVEGRALPPANCGASPPTSPLLSLSRVLCRVGSPSAPAYRRPHPLRALSCRALDVC